jgi:hypothetical protein
MEFLAADVTTRMAPLDNPDLSAEVEVDEEELAEGVEGGEWSLKQLIGMLEEPLEGEEEVGGWSEFLYRLMRPK